jgi:hypothetical protein
MPVYWEVVRNSILIVTRIHTSIPLRLHGPELVRRWTRTEYLLSGRAVWSLGP